MTRPLALHDVHPGIAPGWWPPAPGWWMLAAIILMAVTAIAWWWLRRRRRHRALLRLFEEAIDRAETPAQQVAAMSELLRRAARRRDPAADRLEGEAWLNFLDEGHSSKPFSDGAGALLRDGGFRADVAADDVAALRALARQRYLSWMQRR
ncbi:MAG: DUF4381 domain-containing protein [Thermomonas sp.]